MWVLSETSATPMARDSGGSLSERPWMIVIADGHKGKSVPSFAVPRILNSFARCGRTLIDATNVPSFVTGVSILVQPSRSNRIDAGPGVLSSDLRPTTYGHRSEVIAGYCNQMRRPLSGLILGEGRASRFALAAYMAAPCATSVMESSPSAKGTPRVSDKRWRTTGIAVGPPTRTMRVTFEGSCPCAFNSLRHTATERSTNAVHRLATSSRDTSISTATP